MRVGARKRGRGFLGPIAVCPTERTGLALRRARIGLFLLLIAAAGATLFGAPLIEELVRQGRAPRTLLVVAPALLGAFIALYALYRFALVRAGRYHAGKAFVQVGLMVLVFALSLPGSLDRWRETAKVRAVDLSRYLCAPDAETRAMAAELARHRARSDALRYVPRLVLLLEDSSAEVRRQARASLILLAGSDAGGDGEGAPRRWRAYWKSRGIELP